MPEPGGVRSDPIIVHQFLTVDGDGTGISNAIGDYSSVEEIFYIQPAIDEVMVIHEILLHIVDSGAIAATGYGGMSALTDGLDVLITNANSPRLSMLPGLIKENVDFMHCGLGAFNLVNFTGGIDSIIASFKTVNFGAPIILDGSQEHKIEVVLNDSFVGLVDHHFIAHGFK